MAAPTVSVPVVWLTYTAGERPRDKWDVGLLELIFNRDVWDPVGALDFEHHDAQDAIPEGLPGAVVIFPAGIHAGEHDRFNSDLSKLGWALVILTADEGSLFDAEQVRHPNMRLWVMTPHPKHYYPPGTRFLGEGYASDTRAVMRSGPQAVEPLYDVMFAGQVTHERRRQMMQQLNNLPPNVNKRLIPSEGFTQGLPREQYLRELTAARVAPCPAGPATADSFRLFEALEAGCLPIADDCCPAYDEVGYWDMVAPGHPFPTVTNWRLTTQAVLNAVNDWPGNANHAFAWWQRHKRDMAYWLVDDLRALGQEAPPRAGMHDRVTVLVCTSPIPSNPSTELIEVTIDSIRERLPDCEVIVTVDGIRPEQEDRRPAYEEFTRRLLWKCNHEWRNVLPLVFDGLTHQSGMARQAMRLVRTPLVFYVEHDLPLKGDVPFEEMAAMLDDGTADVIRVTLNTAIEPLHRHLMLDQEPQETHGIKATRTVQWSQQPHLATACYYREMLKQRFDDKPRYIELVMHSVCAGLWHEHGVVAWFRNRLWIYTPDGDMSRCWHTDGRAGDPVYPT